MKAVDYGEIRPKFVKILNFSLIFFYLILLQSLYKDVSYLVLDLFLFGMEEVTSHLRFVFYRMERVYGCV